MGKIKRSSWVASLLAVLAVGCTSSEGGYTVESELTVPVEPVLLSPVASSPPAPVPSEVRDFGEEIAAAPVVAPRRRSSSSASDPTQIDWQTARQVRQTRTDFLARATQASLRTASVPVLVPEMPSLAARARASVGDSWYGLSMRADGHTVYIHGTRRAGVVNQLSELDGVPAGSGDVPVPTIDRGRIATSDGMKSLTFVAFGATYLIEVECDDPEHDRRCMDDAYIRSVSRSLKRAGGT